MNQFIFILILSLFSLFVSASEKEWPKGGAIWAIGKHQEVSNYYKDKNDLLMADIYKILDLKHQNNAVKKQLEAWNVYVGRACYIVGLSTGSGGSWPSAHSAECESKLREAKYISTQKALQCMKDMTPFQIGEGIQRISCLYPTLTITPPKM